MKGKRGELTRIVADKSKEVLGYEITLTELRLMPHVHYQAMNDQRISNRQINAYETEILGTWRDKGFLKIDFTKDPSPLSVSKKFYDAMCAILWLSYVDIKNDLQIHLCPSPVVQKLSDQAYRVVSAFGHQGIFYGLPRGEE